MPKFRVWFRKSFSHGYYSCIFDAPSDTDLHEFWKDDPFFVGVSNLDDSNLPPIVREYRIEKAAYPLRAWAKEG